MECLESMLKSIDVSYSIHLVDNNSDQLDRNSLLQYCEDKDSIKYWPMEVNHGFTKANNIVLESIINAETPPKYIALLNNDTVVENDWLFHLNKTAEKHSADMVSSKMINYYDRALLDSAGHMMLNTGEILPIGHGEKSANYTRLATNFGACAGACLYKTDMLRDIGLFDEYFSTGYEDAELGMRAKTLGYNCLFSPEAIVYHKGGTSVKKVFDVEYSLMIQNAIWYSYLKNMPFYLILFNLPFIICKYFIILILLTITGQWGELATIKKSLFYSISKQGRKHRSKYSAIRKNSMNPFKLIRAQSFFLKADFKRLIRIISSKKSALNSYR